MNSCGRETCNACHTCANEDLVPAPSAPSLLPLPAPPRYPFAGMKILLVDPETGEIFFGHAVVPWEKL
jgi:hypothetical protein